MKVIGIVDTTFSRVDMGAAAISEIQTFSRTKGWDVKLERRTVPGFKDLAVECLRLHDDVQFDIGMAIGWVGGMPIDSQCAQEASQSIAAAQLMLRKHVLEVFIHENESQDPVELQQIALNRAIEHAKNALNMVFDPNSLIDGAGSGRRQGGRSVGPL